MQGDRSRAKEQINTPKRRAKRTKPRRVEERYSAGLQGKIAVVPPLRVNKKKRVAVVHPPLEVMRRAVQQMSYMN